MISQKNWNSTNNNNEYMQMQKRTNWIHGMCFLGVCVWKVFYANV